MPEIILPDAKPAFEWVNGRFLQKVSPQRKHALAQTRFAVALDAWSAALDNGMVGTEWRFALQPPGEERRTLVPDIAFLSYERMPSEEQEMTDVPCIAPDAVVEILSPDDRREDVKEKSRVYLAAGTRVIFIVDPDQRTVIARDASGSRIARDSEMLEHSALPGFCMPVRTLFQLRRK